MSVTYTTGSGEFQITIVGGQELAQYNYNQLVDVVPPVPPTGSL
jgi:hypothetical protein